MLDVQDLSITAGGRPVVTALTLRLDAGERVALLGRSGSGKSLTAAAICGSLPGGVEATGSITVDGRVVLPASRRARRGSGGAVALVRQDSSTALHPLVRVGRQLAQPLRAGSTNRTAVRGAAVALLGSVGIERPDVVLDSFPAELSGGQRQRVCLALALACQNPLLIADEPTTALDVVSQARLLDAFGALPARSTLLLVTHDVAVAAQVCDRVLVLDDGRLVEDAATHRLLAGPRHPYVRALVADALARSVRAA